MLSLSYRVHRGFHLHIHLWTLGNIFSLVLVSSHLSFLFLSSALALLSNANLQERIVYTHYPQFLVSGSHLNSRKSGFYPHGHRETCLAKVTKLFILPTSPSPNILYRWLLFSSQKCLINILPRYHSLSFIISDYSFCFLCWLPSLSSLKCSCLLEFYVPLFSST